MQLLQVWPLPGREDGVGREVQSGDWYPEPTWLQDKSAAGPPLPSEKAPGRPPASLLLGRWEGLSPPLPHHGRGPGADRRPRHQASGPL